MTNATRTTRTTHASVSGPLTLLQAAAVAQWYDELAPDLRRFVAGVLLRTNDTAPDVDDVLQETFIRVMRDLTRALALDTTEHRRNYVWNTARWTARDYYRRRYGKDDAARSGPHGQIGAAVPLSAVANSAMQPVTASHDWQASMQPEQTTTARMTLRAVWEATPLEHREMLALLAAGHDTADIARRLGIKQRAVILRIWRLRQTLREVAGKIA